MNRIVYGLFLLVALSFVACSTTVLRQDIPVSTNPLGARIFADGAFVGYSPTTVSLERTKDHILTLVKDDYRQTDVHIRRLYQRDKVMLNAIRSGVDSGLFFKDARMGVGSGFSAISSQEQSGAAYILAPPTVAVTLYPLAGAQPAGEAASNNEGQTYEGIADAPIDRAALTREVIKTGAAASLADVNPIGVSSKSSSSRTSVTNDVKEMSTRSSSTVRGPNETHTYSSESSRTTTNSSQSTRRSSSSASVGIDPAGLVGLLDVFFK
jgi:hypothetical protein